MTGLNLRLCATTSVLLIFVFAVGVGVGSKWDGYTPAPDEPVLNQVNCVECQAEATAVALAEAALQTAEDALLDCLYENQEYSPAEAAAGELVVSIME